MEVLVIGGNAAGAKAASRIRRLDSDVKITILEQGRYISFAGCGLPYYVSGKVPEFEDLFKTSYGQVRDVGYFRDLKDLDVRTGWRLEKIERDGKRVLARNLEKDETETFPYDKLVLAMGATPIDPDIEGIDLEGVHHLTRPEDAETVARRLREGPPGSAVVVGGSFIGLEAVEALAERKWEVTLLERCDRLFPRVLDFEMAAVVQETLFERMVECELGVEILKIEGDGAGRVARVKTAEDEFDADLVILAAGVRPNVETAREAGLEIGETGALAVDEYLRTSDPDIFAGGDLVENVHLVTGKKCYIPLGSTANKHGRVIGDNVCGLETAFPGILGTFVCKVFDLNVGSTGLSEQAAEEAGLEVVSVSAPGFDKAHYYPGSEMVGLKLVVERETGRLLGLQAAGKGEAARRIDVAASAIAFGATVDQIADLDLAYAPPYSQAMDCLIGAANAARNALDGLLNTVSAQEARALLERGDDVVLLDVRNPNEFFRGHVDDEKVLNIPLEELRSRLGELPGEKRILVTCVSGLRAYSAERLLEGAGFRRVSVVAGGMFLWPWKEDLA